MNWNKDIGNKGEDLAANHLQQLGFEILERNWRFRKWEVDIIASKGKLLHFIEVKTRTNLKYGQPEESITYEKMDCMKNAAEEYQYQHDEWKYIQFDALSILLKGNLPPDILLIEDVYF